MKHRFFGTILVATLAGLPLGCSESLHPPVAEITLNETTVVVGVPLGVDGSASFDSDRDTLAYKWRLSAVPPGSRATIADPSAMTTWVTPDVAGDYVVELVVSDGTFTSGPATQTFTAGPCGANAPRIAAITTDPGTPWPGQAVALSAAVSDADTLCGQTESFTYAWSLVGLPPGSRASLNDAGLITPSLLTDIAGTYSVQLVVTDSEGHASMPFAATVIASGCTTPPGDVTAIDASPAAPSTSDTVTLTATVTPRSSSGSTTTVNDAGVPTDGGSTLPDGATAPTPVPPPSGAAPVCDTPHYTYHWTLVGAPAGSTVNIANSALESPSFTADLPGDYTFEVYVTDDAGVPGAVQRKTITVSDCGSHSPSVDSVTASPAAPAPGQAVLLSATVSDADTGAPCNLTEPLSYHWTLTGLPAGSTARLNDETLSSPSFVVDRPGTYVATLMVTDGAGHSSAPVSTTIVANSCGTNAPTVSAISAAPPAPAIGQPVLLDVTASDADNASPCNLSDGITYHWALTSLPAGSFATLNDASLSSPSFVPDIAGTYQATVMVTDSAGHTSAPATTSITANSCGTNAPTVTFVAAFPAAPSTFQKVQLGAVATDADRSSPCNLVDTVSFRWALVTVPVGSSAALSGATQTAPWFTPDVPGTYTVVVRAIDQAGHESAPATLNVTAATCGSATPTVSAITLSPSSPKVGDGISASATISDADTGCGVKETFTYSWVFTAVPSGSVATLTSATAPVTGFTADKAGTYTLGLTVTDSEGHVSARATKSISVGAKSVCGTQSPTALLSSFTAASCASVCSAATITPSIASGPSPTSPNYTIQLNGFASVQLDGSGSFDPDNLAGCALNQALFYQWSLLTAPVGSQAAWSIGGATTNMVAPTFNTDLPGTYQVELLVSDGTHLSSPLIIQIQR